jgi:flagellar basal body-associated protein FliL
MPDRDANKPGQRSSSQPLIPLVLIGVVCLAVGAASGFILGREKIKADHGTVSDKLAAANSQLADVTAKLTSAEKRAADAVAKLARPSQELTQLQAEVASLKLQVQIDDKVLRLQEYDKVAMQLSRVDKQTESTAKIIESLWPYRAVSPDDEKLSREERVAVAKAYIQLSLSLYNSDEDLSTRYLRAAIKWTMQAGITGAAWQELLQSETSRLADAVKEGKRYKTASPSP